MRKMKENYPSVWDVLKEYEKSGHGQLVKACCKKLRAEGYRIISCELTGYSDISEEELRYKIAPKYGLTYGDIARHDVVAEKD